MAVRGIAEHGLPLLPSGLLYDRGILYSYVSWLAHAITGSELPAYRAVSFVCAMLALWLVFKLVKRIHNASAGVLASALVATSIPFWATATTARFYAPFFVLYLAALLSLQNVVAVFVIAILARLTHELAFTMAAIPLICLLVDRANAKQWIRATVAIVTGLLLGQLLLIALHWLSPADGNTMVRRFFLWQVLNLFERPGDRQFMIPIVVMVIGWLIAPQRAWKMSVIALSISAAIFAFSVAQASNTVPLNRELITSVAVDGSRYPLDMLWHIARTTPLTLFIAMSMLLVRVLRGDWIPRWTRFERGLHALWIGWVLWFGVIESGITTNYLLLPTAFMLMAIAVDVMVLPIVKEDEGDLLLDPDYETPTSTRVFAVVIVLIFVLADRFIDKPFAVARPTIVAEGIDQIKNSLQPNDRVVCTDELGCMMLIGRIDRWLALDDYVRERFIVKKGDGPVTGVYTGVPAVLRPSEVFDANADGTLPNRILIVDIFKDYPIGNSRSWLPKAIEEDGVPVTPLLETPQFRVIEVSRPERIAGLR